MSVSSLLMINEPPLMVLPALVKTVGFLEAVVLQETHYHLRGINKLKYGRRWAPNLAHHLRRRCPYMEPQVLERIIRRLERTGILLVRGACHTIDYDFLSKVDNIPLKVVQHTTEHFLYPFAGVNANRGFLFNIEVRPITHNLYSMRAENKGHLLACELKLQIARSRQQSQVSCHFPRINSKKILKICKGAHIVYNIIMIFFQASLLDQLLLFSAKQRASNLVIVPNNGANLSFYRGFLLDLGLAKAKEQHTEMIIPVSQQTRLKLANFMKGVHFNLKRSLQAQQKTNPLIAELAAKLLPGFLNS